jgi:NAD(P)-dependent dehydrogenase (short-subunit alcohol dehydrogenase family)
MDTLLMRMDEKQWDTVINVNLKSVFNFTKSCTNAPCLKTEKDRLL